MPNTMTMPKKGQSEDMMPPSPKREALERYRVEVDRLTKSSFKSACEAEKVGGAIKKDFPKLHVTVFDVESHETTVL